MALWNVVADGVAATRWRWGCERGVKAEADIASAGPAGLLRSVIGNLDALLPRQSAVAAAFALGPPLPGDGLAVCVATPGQRAAWPSAACAGGCDLPWARPEYDLCSMRPRGTDAGLLVCVKARGLVRIGEGGLACGHPLIRGAVHHRASAGSAETRTARSLA
jgi:hypothetical protein